MTSTELMKRDERSTDLMVFKANDQDYFVESSKKMISYKVILNNGHRTCSCGDFANNIQKNPEFMCKHILAVMNANGSTIPLSTLKHKPKLDDRFITNLKGKDFVLYAGLLDLGHQHGLSSLEVELIQVPTADNGMEAICRATAITSSGQTFVDFGDANPKNCNKLIANHIIRMASTRAKARVLRDMSNIGMTALEEIGGDEEITTQPIAKPKKSTADLKSKVQSLSESDQTGTAKPSKQTGEAKPPKQAGDNKQSAQSGNGKPSSAQVNAIKNLAYRRGLNDEDIDKLAKDKMNIPSFQDLSADQAGKFIKILQQAA